MDITIKLPDDFAEKVAQKIIELTEDSKPVRTRLKINRDTDISIDSIKPNTFYNTQEASCLLDKSQRTISKYVLDNVLIGTRNGRS
ncbi:hypothetical protein, partial [Saccharophagus degradans]